MAILGVLVLATSCRAVDDGVPVEHLDVSLVVHANGSVTARETARMRVEAGVPLQFERRVDHGHFDAVSFVAASMDGQQLMRGRSDTGRLDVEDGDRLRVRWEGTSVHSGMQTFVLEYRAEKVVAVEGIRGRLRWPSLPARQPPDAASVALKGDDVRLLRQGTGVAEAGWTVEWRENGVAARRDAPGPGDRGTLLAELEVDPALTGEPLWWLHAERGRQLVPAFISGGLFILVIGAGVLWMVRFQYRTANVPPAERASVTLALRRAGIVCVVFAAFCALVVRMTLSHFGPWPMAMPVSIAVTGVVLFITAGWAVRPARGVRDADRAPRRA